WRLAMSMFGTLTLALAALAMSALGGAKGGWEVHLKIAVLGVLAGTGWFVFVAPLFLLTSKVHVAADGIKCLDWFGFYHFAPWETIERVKPINLLGVRSLRVWSSATPRTLRVPLHLADLPGFYAAVMERAGRDHPLAQALATYRPLTRRAGPSPEA